MVPSGAGVMALKNEDMGMTTPFRTIVAANLRVEAQDEKGSKPLRPTLTALGEKPKEHALYQSLHSAKPLKDTDPEMLSQSKSGAHNRGLPTTWT